MMHQRMDGITPEGIPFTVTGDPNMRQETRNALDELVSAAHRHFAPQGNTMSEEGLDFTKLKKRADALIPADVPVNSYGDEEVYVGEDEHEHVLFNCPYDLTGEGDYAEWNRRAANRGKFLNECLRTVPRLLSELERCHLLLSPISEISVRPVWIEIGNCPAWAWCVPLTGTVRHAYELTHIPTGRRIFLDKLENDLSKSLQLWAKEIWDKEPSVVGAVEAMQGDMERHLETITSQ